MSDSDSGSERDGESETVLAPSAPPQDAARLARYWPAALGVVLLGMMAATIAAVRPHPAPRHLTESLGIVTSDGVALKKGPSPGAETIGRLAGGLKVVLVADLGRWYEVRTEKGESGFVTADAVEKQAEREARERQASIIAAFPPVFGLVAEDTDVLLAPFPQAPRNGRLARGAVIAIHAVDHSFYAFKTKAGQIAYINSAEVDLVPADPSKPDIKPALDRAVKGLSVSDTARLPESEPEGPAEGPGLPPAADAPEAVPGGAGHRSASLPSPLGVEALEAAVLVSRVEPSYPERARRAGIEGTVELEVGISANGDITDIEVVRGLPLGVSEAAADAIRRWKYRPARGKDGPVASRKTVRILFTLGH
jgi:TonB family protein